MASFLIFGCPNRAGSRRPVTIAATFRRDDVEHPALRLEAQRGHASLVGVGTLHVLAFSTRKLTVSLVDAPVYRRIPCSVLLGCLLGRCLRGESGCEKPQCECMEKIICVPHGISSNVSANCHPAEGSRIAALMLALPRFSFPDSRLAIRVSPDKWMRFVLISFWAETRAIQRRSLAGCDQSRRR
jgi:hypothetical protein